MTRLLHVGAGKGYGGTERLLVALARAGAEGLRPTLHHEFAFFFEGRVCAELRRYGAPVEVLGGARLLNPLSRWRAARRLVRMARASAADVVVCHGGWAHVMAGPQLGRAGIRHWLWAHDLPSRASWLDRWCALNPPAAILANSEATRQAVAAFFPSVSVRTVYCPVYGIPPEAGREARRRVRAELGTPADRLVIVQASRLTALKGHARLLDALSSVGSPDWECWIAGGAASAEEREYRLSLETLASRLGIVDRVRFLGHRDDILEILSAADICCQPNTAPDSFGILFVEALGAGLPVVTPLIGGAREILAPLGMEDIVQPADLVRVLDGLLGSADRRRALGEAGRLRARELCDPVTQLAALERAVTELCGGSRPARQIARES